jgi:hypothetical protein
MGWLPVADLGWGRSPKLHGMQEFTGVGLAVPGVPIQRSSWRPGIDGVRGGMGPGISK